MDDDEYDYFISYSGDDLPLARGIYEALSRREIGKKPYRICFQDVSFRLGDSFTESMDRALRGSRIVLAVLTPNYLAKSMFTRAEFDAGWTTGRLLVFRFDGANMPAYASTVVFQDFDRKPGEVGFDELVRTAATRQPSAASASTCRVDLESNMPLWKGTASTEFVGREEEMAFLNDAWRDPQCRIVCVIADGGYGKSSLINRWMAQVRRPTSYLDVQAGYAYSFYKQGWETHSAVSSAPFFGACASFLMDVPEDRLPKDAKQRADRILDVCKSRRTLLVLDGLEPHQKPRGDKDEGEIDDLTLRSFINSMRERQAGGLCVITSRIMPANLKGLSGSGEVRTIELKSLKPDASRRVLVTAGVPEDHPDLSHWAERSGGHPLLLALLAPAIISGDYAIETFESHRVLTRNGDNNYHAIVRNFVLSHLARLGPQATAVLYATCMFGRPVTYGELRSLLLDRATIPHVTAPLRRWSGFTGRRLSDAAFADGAHRLITAAMLTIADNDVPPGSKRVSRACRFEAHPLIQAGVRQHLADELKAVNRRANYVIYRSICRSVKPLRPDKLEDLKLLYSAVPHGVNAGRGKTAGWMYGLRCLRGFRAYSTNQHGMIGDDISVMSHYFTGNWGTVREDVGLNRYATVHAYVWSGCLLVGTGRAATGRSLMMEGLAKADESRNFTTASRTARILASSLLMSGQFAEAETYIRQALDYLDRPRSLQARVIEWRLVNLPFQRMAGLATLGSALHFQGRFDEAEAAFDEATAVQKRAVPFDRLRGIWCFRQADLLLDQGRFDEADALIASGMVDPDNPQGWGEGIFALPLLQLSFLRSRVRRADSTGERRDWPEAIRLANEFARFGTGGHALRMDWLIPAFSVAGAAVARLSDDPDAGATPLREAKKQVERTGNVLFAPDLLLEEARYALAAGRRDEAAAALKQARQLCEEMNYVARAAVLNEVATALAAEVAPSAKPT